jgi:hypothetical protein
MYVLKYKKKAIKVLSKINNPYYTNIIASTENLVQNPHLNGY